MWKSYVPKKRRREFRNIFLQRLVARAEEMMHEACSHGTRHYYYDCPRENKEEECWDCYDDSDIRDIKDEAHEFYKDLWEETFFRMDLKPEEIKPQEEEENDGEEEEEGSEGESSPKKLKTNFSD